MMKKIKLNKICKLYVQKNHTWKYFIDVKYFENLIFKQSAAPTLANARLRRHRPSAGGGAWACWDEKKLCILEAI